MTSGPMKRNGKYMYKCSIFIAYQDNQRFDLIVQFLGYIDMIKSSILYFEYVHRANAITRTVATAMRALISIYVRLSHQRWFILLFRVINCPITRR